MIDTTAVDERVRARTLGNGLQMYVLPKPGFHKKYAVFATNYGSIHSQFHVANEGLVTVPDGIAHFLEHKLFEEESGNVFERFSQYGASVNAYTSYTLTSYLFSTIDNFDESLCELVRFVQTPYLTDENVEKEKGIIEQELRMYEDHPGRCVYQNLLRAMYHHHPVKIDIGGTVSSIGQITVDLLMMCYRRFYHPSNMALFVTGDVQPDHVFSIVSEAMPPWRFGDLSSFELVQVDEPETVKEHKVEQTLTVSRPRCFLGFKAKPKPPGRDLMKQEIVMNLLWRLVAAKSSAINEELYNDGLIDDTFGASFSQSPSYAFSVVGGETDHPNVLEQRLRSWLGELQEEGVREEDLNRLKRRAYGSYLTSFDSLDFVANRFLAQQFQGVSLYDFPEILAGVTVADLAEAMAECVNLDHAAVSILWPQ